MTEHYPEHVQWLIEACRKYSGLDPRDVLDAINDPQWGRAKRVSDWRNEVVGEIEALWCELTLEGRLVAYLAASIRAKGR